MTFDEADRARLLEALDLLRRETRAQHDAMGSLPMSDRGAERAYNALGRELIALASLEARIRG